ncbi:aldolase [Bacillus sp. AK128]
MNITLKNKIVYKAFGLIIDSEIPLPEVNNYQSGEYSPQVIIRVRELTEKWDRLGIKGNFKGRKNSVIFRVPNTAIFLIEEGERVIVSPIKGSDEEKIRLYILGTCMGVLLMQRGILPLHGSAISIMGKAYAIVGDSGAGKSTLASAFISRGNQLLSDDVIAVSLSQERSIVYPSFPQQKLWEKSLNEFGMDKGKYRPLFERENKFAVPVDKNFYSEPLQLAGIFELNINNKNEICIREISKLEQLYRLYLHTYRQFLIKEQGLTDWHFNITSQLANKVDFYKIERPNERFTANELADLILEKIK